MKNIYLSLTLVAILCLSGWAGYTRGQGTNSRRQNWEYRVDIEPGTATSISAMVADQSAVWEHNRVANERLINQRAAEGWELTAVGGYFYYFKRAK
jgi:hypothetical protein